MTSDSNNKPTTNEHGHLRKAFKNFSVYNTKLVYISFDLFQYGVIFSIYGLPVIVMKFFAAGFAGNFFRLSFTLNRKQ
jgi:hypothetical protein